MKNLLEQVQERTRKNLVKQTTKKNICDHLHEELFEKKQKLSRKQIIDIVTEYRLLKEFPELSKNPKLEDKHIKRLDSIMITVKNGLDTAVCNGSTGSSYVSNSKYQDYKLNKDGDILSITKK